MTGALTSVTHALVALRSLRLSFLKPAYLSLAALGGLPLACSAATLTLQAGSRYVEYEERLENDETLLSEQGTLPYAALAYGWTVAAAFRINVAYARHSGTLDYRGQTQLGRALTTRTQHRQQSIALSGQYSLSVYNTTLTPRLGGQWVSWQRRIEATTATSQLELNYHWLQWFAGVELEVPVDDAWDFIADYTFYLSHSGRVSVDFESPEFQSLSLGTNRRETHRLQAGLRRQWSSWSAALVVEAQSWQWQESDSQRLASAESLTFREPKSQQTSLATHIVISKRL